MNDESQILTATLYKIEGLPSSYRFGTLVPREKIPNDNQRPIRMQKWADKMWRDILKCPVYCTSRFGEPAFLVQEDRAPSQPLEILDVPDVLYHLDVGEVVEIPIAEAAREEKELISNMIERVITDRLRRLKNDFWREQWTLFFFVNPENKDYERDEINAYRGFKFGVVFLNDIPHLAVDARTKYYSRRALADFDESERETLLGTHLDTTLAANDRGTFVIDSLGTKTPCVYAGPTGNSIDEQTIESLGITVFEYYKKHYPTLTLDKEDRALFVIPRGRGNMLMAPESRLFPVFSSESDIARRCSIRSQIEPKARLALNRRFVEFLTGINYDGAPIKVSRKPFVRDRTVFLPPTLEFGSSKILSAFSDGAPEFSSTDLDTHLSRFGSKKIASIYEYSPFHNEPIPSIVLLYPKSIDRPTRERFLEALKKDVLLQSNQKVSITGQVEYQIGLSERMGRSMLQKAAEIKKDHENCCVLVVFWSRLDKSVHTELKRHIAPLHSQCAWERTVNDICYGSGGRKRSKLRNLSLALATEVGIKPWVLHDGLHHDLHIGIDTLYGQICYNYLFGLGGRHMKSRTGRATTRGRMHEAVKKSELERQLVTDIREIVKEGHEVRSIVVHRDGRLFPSERRGLQLAISRLVEEKVIAEDVRYCVAEIRKTHKPIRLFSISDTGQSVRNPVPGTYLIVDAKQIIVNTTGKPGEWDVPHGRSARTILLDIVEEKGAFSVTEVAEDAYRLTHLNWNSPDIEIGLPVTIRWADDYLRETLLPTSDYEVYVGCSDEESQPGQESDEDLESSEE